MLKNRIAKVLGVLAVIGLLASLIPVTLAQGAGGPRHQRLLVFTDGTNADVVNDVAAAAVTQ